MPLPGGMMPSGKARRITQRWFVSPPTLTGARERHQEPLSRPTLRRSTQVSPTALPFEVRLGPDNATTLRLTA
jgi:hypothetical protein